MTAHPAYLYGPADEAAAVLESRRRRDEAFFERLENWRRWGKKRVWVSADIANRARSLETAYRSPIWYAEDVNFQRWSTDEKDAWEVEKAWSGLPDTPIDYRTCVRSAFLWGEPYRTTCRRLKIHWSSYDQVLERAFSMMRNRLK